MSNAFRARLTNILTQVNNENRRRASKKNKVSLNVPDLTKKFHIVRGDKVQVIGQHPEAGKQGIVQQVVRSTNRVIVQGVNIRPHHIKGNPDRGIPGRTASKEASIPYANVNLVDPVTNQPTRIYQTYLDDGTKVRVSKKSGAVIPRPDVLRFRKRPINSLVCPVSDTSDAADVWEITYQLHSTKLEDSSSSGDSL